MMSPVAFGSAVVPPQFSEGRIPNLQSVTIRVQMSVLESIRIFQAKSKHSVKADVSDPNEGDRKYRNVMRPERVTSQHQWSDVAVDGVVRERPQTNVGG